MKNSDIQFKRECLWRHYKNMDKYRALKLMGGLTVDAKCTFIRRINHAKGYAFVK